MHARAWFHFRAERPRYWRRRDGPLHALPLWMLEEIGRLQRETEARQKSRVDPGSKRRLGEGGARLDFVLQKAAAANDLSDRRKHSVPRRAATAARRLRTLISRMRSLLSRTARTPGRAGNKKKEKLTLLQ